MRLDRFVAIHLGCTRKLATHYIRANKITVDDESVTSPATRVEPNQVIKQNSIELKIASALYIMMYKPAGYVCSAQDAKHSLVNELIDWNLLPVTARDQLQTVGRLDVDTTGLLLLTTDGQWNQALRSPRKKVSKRYLVTLEAVLNEKDKNTLEQGLLLRSDDKPTAACTIIQTDSPKQVYITLHEGRYHQVKRMFAAVGNHVVALHRDKIGPWSLDMSLAPSQYRALSPTELKMPLA